MGSNSGSNEEISCWIIAVIAPEELEAVRQRLLLIDVADITASHAMGFDRNGGEKISYRGIAATIPKARVRLEVGCSRDRADSVVAAIRTTIGRCHQGATQDSAAIVAVLAVDQGASALGAFRRPVTGSFRPAT
jgi:nitrogen regulatory protein PII